MDKTYVYSNSDLFYFYDGDDKDDGVGCDDYDDNNNEGIASQRTPGNDDRR